MIFLELVLQNFGPYLGRQVVNLRPEVFPETRPIILLGGMNGGGKTTLMDAIRLALYGHRAQCSTRGNLSYSDFLSQSVNSETSPTENTRVELLLEHIVNGEKVELRIVRSWTKYQKDGKDTLGILKDDWAEKGLESTWDEYIENILPLGISNLFLFDGEQVKELAEQDTPPTAVVEAIQSLLGLELAEKLAIDLDVLASRKRKAVASKKELATLEEIEAKLKELELEKEENRKQQEKRQHDLERATKRQQEAMSKFLSEGGKIASESTRLQAEKKRLDKTAEETREQLRHLASGMLPLGLISPLLNSVVTQGEKELQRQEAEMTRDSLKARDERLLNHVRQLCLEKQQLNSIQEFLTQENEELESKIATTEKPWLECDRATLSNLQILLSNSLPDDISKTQQHLNILKQLEIDITATETQLATAASPEDYKKLEETLNKAQTQRNEAQVAFDLGKQERDQIESAIAQTKKELQTFSEEVIDRRNDEHIVKSIARVKKTLQLFKERLTLKKLNKLEVEVTDCFRYLLHKSNLIHRVSIDNSNFTLSLFDPQGKPVPKHRLSAGEKQLLAIAFLWGLARVSGRRLPVAIDTPLGRLDSSHRNNLVTRYFPSASHQVILLSTDTEVGQDEVELLTEQGAIAQKHLLHYDPSSRQTSIKPGYFW